MMARSDIVEDLRSGSPANAVSSDDPGAVLEGIFRRVLRLPSVQAEADFFDLGGDSILALELLLEIERATGRKLPVTAVYDAPSIAKIAALLRSDSRIAHESLVLLKAGEPGLPPLFLAHGLGSTAMELQPLARILDIPNAIYCLEARGLDGADAPLDSVEDMAAYFRGEIRKLQPHGPYLLGGQCFGGIVAFELAQQLSQGGESVALLVLLSTFPHARYWPIGGRFQTWIRLAGAFSMRAAAQRLMRDHIPTMRALPMRQVGPYVIRLIGRSMTLPFRIFGLSAYVRTEHSEILPGEVELALPDALRHVHQAARVAFANYRPRRYDGELAFLNTESAARLPYDGVRIWRRLVARLSVVTIRGDRQDMLGSQLPAVAGELARLVRAAPTG